MDDLDKVIDINEERQKKELSTSVLPEQINRKPRKRGRWVPKKWNARNEQIVALSCTGVSNIYLAEKFGMTTQQISNILNTPQAAVIRNLIMERMRKSNLEKIPDRLDRLQIAAVEICEDVLINQKTDLVKHKPLAVLQAAMSYLKSTNKEMKAVESPAVVNNINISTSLYQQLIKGMEESNEVLKLHGGGTIHEKSKAS